MNRMSKFPIGHVQSRYNFLCLILVFLVFAQTPSSSPYAVKQDVLGESLAQYQANNPKDCPVRAFQADKDRGAVFCTVVGLTTYAGEAINNKKVGFMHDRLYLITMNFPHSSFLTVKAALSERFGKPVERIVERSVYITFAEILSHKEKTHEERLNVPEIGTSDKWKNAVSEIDAEEYDTLAVRLYSGNELKVEEPSRNARSLATQVQAMCQYRAGLEASGNLANAFASSSQSGFLVRIHCVDDLGRIMPRRGGILDSEEIPQNTLDFSTRV
jgi:hypothetical protein